MEEETRAKRRRRLGSHHRCAGRRRRRWWRWRSGSGDGGRPPTPYARPPTQVVVAAYDATKEHNEHELRLALRGDTLLVLGVLHTVTNSMGYQTKACTDSFAGTSSRYPEEEVLKKVELYKSRLLDSAEKCKEVGVTMRVKIIAEHQQKWLYCKKCFLAKLHGLYWIGT